MYSASMYYCEHYLDNTDKLIGIRLLEHILSNIYNPLITYGDLARRVGFTTGHGTLDCPLGNLSAFCEVNGLPRISAVVYNYNTKIPGRGFFDAFYAGVPESQWGEILQDEYQGIIDNREELQDLLDWMSGKIR